MSEVQSALTGISGILSLWVGLVITIVGGIISFTNFFYLRKKDKFNSLFGVFNHLNDIKHREARHVLYYGAARTSSMIILGFNAKSTDLKRVCKDIVRDDLDQMGLMIESGLIPEKQFLERYWKTVIDCRWYLNSDITTRRKLRDYKKYVMNFDLLRERACSYAKEHDLLGPLWTDMCKTDSTFITRKRNTLRLRSPFLFSEP